MEEKQSKFRVGLCEGMNPQPSPPTHTLLQHQIIKSTNLVQNRTETSGWNATIGAKCEVQ